MMASATREAASPSPSRLDPVTIVATALDAETVCVAGLRLRPISDEEMARKAITALKVAGFDIVAHQPAKAQLSRSATEGRLETRT
jgi:hypothetical protein